MYQEDQGRISIVEVRQGCPPGSRGDPWILEIVLRIDSVHRSLRIGIMEINMEYVPGFEHEVSLWTPQVPTCPPETVRSITCLTYAFARNLGEMETTM